MDWLDTCMTAAMLAPSGDNLQPWAFGLDRRRCVVVLSSDATRDPSPMNAGNAMARISVGAVVANILYAHTQNDRRLPHATIGGAGTVTLSDVAMDDPPGEVPALLRRRYTDRASYGGEVSGAELARLAARASLELTAWAPALGVSTAVAGGLSIHLITDREAIEDAADILSEADRTLFGHDAARAAFLDAICRAEHQGGETAREGLPVDSLALGRGERHLFRLCLKFPPRWLRYLAFPASVAARTRRLLLSSPALAVVTAPDWTAVSDVLVGILTQIFWIGLTHAHMVGQPMMALPVLRNMARHELLPDAAVDSLERRFRELATGLEDQRIGFIFRMGRATRAGHSPGRLPWKSLAYELEETEGEPAPTESAQRCLDKQAG